MRQHSQPVDTLASSTAAVVQSDSSILRLRLITYAYVLALQCLVMAMPILKLVGVSPFVNWSWLWVLAPTWGPGALLTLIVSFERLVEVLQGMHSTKTQLAVNQPS